MIYYISAKNGGIEMSDSNGVVGFADTAEGIVNIMCKYGLDRNVYGSSTMDFADEEGFDHHDGAKNLWGQALEIYNWNVNKVA